MSERDDAGWVRLAELLDAVIDLAPEQRTAALQQNGASDEEIVRVEAMLAREQTRGGALNRLLGQWAGHDAAASVAAGDVLGRWRLVRLVGAGGMASVWLAERADGSVEQRVALKCLKAGLHSPELRALFAREQQILARLQHPHIARMYDSGIADNGLPYLVMELVDGEPLTSWCDRQQLDPRQRLRLFDQVLDAVQFAHRELIVHRDLKPGNILVDRRGDLKLLDFGIAHLIDDDSPDAPLNRYRALTPEYAAPEQLAGQRVGLGADIYALGLLLHELLTGCRPARDADERHTRPYFSQASRADPGFDPLLVAARRQRTPSRLKREMSGDLDAIIGRCLAEVPDQRYPSVDGLRRDLNAWLARRPVSARAAGALHRTRLFLVRHWLPSAAAGIALMAVLLGAALAIWQGWEARSARAAMAVELERSTTLNRFILDLFEGARLGLPRDQTPSTRDLLVQGAEQARHGFVQSPELQADLLTLIGGLLINVGLGVEAVAVLADAVELRAALYPATDPSLGQARFEYARALHQTKGAGEAVEELQLAVTALRGSEQQALLARALHELGFALSSTLQFDEALAAHEEALPIQREQGDPEALGIGLSMVARTLQRASRLEEARFMYRESLDHLTAELGSRHYALAQVLSDYGVTLRRLAEYELAEQTLHEAIEASEGVYTGPHVTMAQRWNNLGVVLATRGKRQEAIDAFEAAMSIQQELAHEGFNPALVGVLNNLGVLSMTVGDHEQAEDYLLRAIDALEPAGGREHMFHITFSHNLARNWLLQQRYDEAEALLCDALERATTHWPAHDERASGILSALGQAQWQRDRDSTGLDRIRQAYQLMLSHHGNSSDHTARRALELAEALLLVDVSEAKELFEQALQISEAQFPSLHHQVLAARVGLAEAWLQLERPDRARAVVEPLGVLPPPGLGERDPLRARLVNISEQVR